MSMILYKELHLRRWNHPVINVRLSEDENSGENSEMMMRDFKIV